MNKLKKVAITLAVILFILTNIKYSLGVTGKITAETIRIRAEATTDSKIIEIGNLGFISPVYDLCTVKRQYKIM